MSRQSTLIATLMTGTLIAVSAVTPGYSKPRTVNPKGVATDSKMEGTKNTAENPDSATKQKPKTDSTTETQTAALNDYKIEVARRIRRAYYPPKCQSPGSATLSVHINKTGAIHSIRMIISSGCPLYDRCALDAVERVGSFTPLPGDVTDVHAQITFDSGLFNRNSAVRFTGTTTDKSATIPKTQSAGYLTAARTVAQLTAALRAADFDRAQMDVAGLRNDGIDMVIKLIFKQVEMSTQSGLKHSTQNIDEIINKYALFSGAELDEIRTLTKPLTAKLASEESLSLKSDREFLSKLADLFDKLDQLTKPSSQIKAD